MSFYKHIGFNLSYIGRCFQLARYKYTSCKFYGRSNPLKLTFPCQHVYRRYCFQSFKDDSDSDTEEVEFKRNIKSLILPEEDDPLIAKICESNSVQEIFDLIRINEEQLNWKNISMALAMIRELQIIYFRVYMYEKNLNCSELSSKENFENILTNPEFIKILNLLEENYEQMNNQCLSYCVLCLYKLGVETYFQTYEKLIHRLKNVLISTPVEEINTCILSRYTVAIVSRRDLSSVFMLKDIWPIILKKLYKCDSYEDLRHLSICLYNLQWFLNKSIMDIYAEKVKEILLNDSQEDDKIKCTVKSLRLLNSPYWSNQNIYLIRTLLLQLCGAIKNIALYDLIQLQMVILKQLEPYELFDEIHKVTTNWLSKSEAEIDITLLRLLSCIVPSATPVRRKKIEALLRKQFLLENNVFAQACVGPLFNIIRNLKTSDTKICHAYWSSVLNCLQTGEPTLREPHKLLRLCNRYMHFNNNMAGTYRHYAFENQMILWLNNELEKGLSAHVPSRFSKIFAFFVSYPNEIIGNEIPEKFVRNVLNNLGQYNVYDCYIVSRGLHTALFIRKKKCLLPKFLDQYVRLGTALNKRSLELLSQNDDLNINQLNAMFRGYNNRYNVGDPELFYKLLDKFKKFTSNDFSSRSVRELTYNLSISDWYDRELMNSCAEYCLNNHKYILADNVEKLLTLFYTLGVHDEKFLEFLPYGAEIINRDKHKMSGLNFMKASLALCYFHTLPSSITNYLFSVEFLERLDDELNNCYAKAVFPQKVRQLLMVLNRAVCLDYPELEVPWFHTKYCEEIQSLVSRNTSSFYSDVEQRLKHLIKNNGFIRTNSYSPYSYKLDFEINLKTDDVSSEATNNNKLALMLLNENDLRKNDNELRGYFMMKKRHLEILGYKVIWIKKNIWNSMFMSEPDAKMSYLRNLIWPKEK
ncbi:FAST kinase domain-containing protein 1, mitochondrial [Adelges cooleyi]|uniref:FAST kinase domain-containing protein 1, mitochondrial n=1 Tax=Adelges cooleyi TaxID=133065 RepID=UPI00217FFF05|nr:FAST kinase domain-containing protein 1, mitochondrial [Adelges cooleyi]XP_050441715.1 FAST kinase domain-containing protein 1, mitochondrial [Adelges cooleyi]XP_050441716.1 FAST kinase domain-containing protein 1, mitochondrial [Adelges cooleyi]